MKRIIAFLAFTFTVTQAHSYSKLSRPYFYEITSPNGNKSYLLATIHIGISSNRLPKKIFKALNNSATFISEESFEKLSDPLISQFLNNPVDAIINNNPLPKKPINLEVKDLLISELNLPEKLSNILDNEHPCLAIFQMNQAIQGQMDFELMKYANKLGKKMIALDTESIMIEAGEVENNLKSDPTSEEVCKLKDLDNITTFENSKQRANYFTEMYERGDLNGWETNDPTVHVRTYLWQDTIIEELNKGNAFIIMGIGHVYGKRGILELLVEKGYTNTLIH